MSGYVSVELRRQIRDRFGGCCAYCRSAEELNVATFEIEHITPRSGGGETVFDNLCFACPSCNRHKADRILVLNPANGEQIPLFHPQRDRWDEHFEWSADFTEIVPLSACGTATIAALMMNRPQLIRVRRMWVEMGEHPPIL